MDGERGDYGGREGAEEMEDGEELGGFCLFPILFCLNVIRFII